MAEPSQVEMAARYAVSCASESVADYGWVAFAAPILVSKNITPEIIQEMKTKWGKVKVLDVIVEPAIYDIDELTQADKANLRRLDIDVDIVCNQELGIENRVAPLMILAACMEDAKKREIVKLLPPLTGELLEEAEHYQFLVKRPDRSTMKIMQDAARKGDVEKANDVAVKNLVIGGDMDALENGIVYADLCTKLGEFMQVHKSFLSRA